MSDGRITGLGGTLDFHDGLPAIRRNLRRARALGLGTAAVLGAMTVTFIIAPGIESTGIEAGTVRPLAGILGAAALAAGYVGNRGQLHAVVAVSALGVALTLWQLNAMLLPRLDPLISTRAAAQDAADLADGARALVDAGTGCVAVTRGARGALVVTRDEVLEVPAYAVDVVDTTGCGDAFSAGFLLGRCLGRSLADAAALGCATAAQVAGGLGTDAGVYDLAAVEAFMASTPTR